MVIYNHTGNLAVSQGVHNEVIDFIPQTRFFKPFFMPAFFVIAGYCSNYKKDFKSFFVSNAKALLIPAVTLLIVRTIVRYLLTGTLTTLEISGLISKSVFFDLGYWNWFLTALFTTKLIFYFLLRWIKSFTFRLSIVSLLHVVGVLLYNYKGESLIYFNYYFYQHAILFLVFIEIGYDIANSNIKSLGICANSSIFFAIYIIYLIIGRTVPSITSDPYLPFEDIIPHALMAVCGSLMVIEFSKIIGERKFLEQFGRHSLVIYCLHFQFMFSFYQIFKEQLNQMGVHHTITALIIMYIFTAYGCLWCSKVLNTRYLRWLLGKF